MLPRTGAEAADALRLGPPLRTFAISLDADEAWGLVTQTIASRSEFKYIVSDDGIARRLVARTAEVPVRVALGTKQQRRQVTVELREVKKGIYHCYIDVRVEELWAVNKDRWTQARDADLSDLAIVLAEHIAQQLRPYFDRR